MCSGGRGQGRRLYTYLTLVVLLEGEWFTVASTALEKFTQIKYASVHNGIAYFKAREWPLYFLVQCPVASLLAACMQSHDKPHDCRLDMQVKQISLSTGNRDYQSYGQIVTSQNQLYVLHHELINEDSTPAQLFVYAGDLPSKCLATRLVTTLHANELLVVTLARRLTQWKVSKGLIRREAEGGGGGGEKEREQAEGGGA